MHFYQQDFPRTFLQHTFLPLKPNTFASQVWQWHAVFPVVTAGPGRVAEVGQWYLRNSLVSFKLLSDPIIKGEQERERLLLYLIADPMRDQTPLCSAFQQAVPNWPVEGQVSTFPAPFTFGLTLLRFGCIVQVNTPTDHIYTLVLPLGNNFSAAEEMPLMFWLHPGLNLTPTRSDRVHIRTDCMHIRTDCMHIRTAFRCLSRSCNFTF